MSGEEKLRLAKSRSRTVRMSEAEMDLQHAVVRGIPAEIDRLRALVSAEKALRPGREAVKESKSSDQPLS